MPVSRIGEVGSVSDPCPAIELRITRPMLGNRIPNDVTACEEHIRPIKTPVLGCGVIRHSLSCGVRS